ncbi:MAG: MaoC/PaaZ C-terminal domain-containing protein [Gammaproteobacteria bacterium]
MPIDYDHLLGLRFPQVEHRYTERDTILYALGCGLGLDPLDENQLRFVYEAGLRSLPSMAVVLANPGVWYREMDTGLDYTRIVHGEESLVLHAPLPAAATVAARTRVLDVIDKGPGRGALVISERTIFDKSNGAPLATVTQTAFCRGDGGFGGPPREAPKPHIIPERAADLTCALPTSPQAALIYRLSGDPNPLHVESAAARHAGYARPILHGLSTFGVVCHALLRSACGYDPAPLRSMQARFTAPVFPGDVIRTEIWRDGDVLSFRARADERVVIDHGRATLVAPRVA